MIDFVLQFLVMLGVHAAYLGLLILAPIVLVLVVLGPRLVGRLSLCLLGPLLRWVGRVTHGARGGSE